MTSEVIAAVVLGVSAVLAAIVTAVPAILALPRKASPERGATVERAGYPWWEMILDAHSMAYPSVLGVVGSFSILSIDVPENTSAYILKFAAGYGLLMAGVVSTAALSMRRPSQGINRQDSERARYGHRKAQPRVLIDDTGRSDEVEEEEPRDAHVTKVAQRKS